jgi:hypothetical protein
MPISAIFEKVGARAPSKSATARKPLLKKKNKKKKLKKNPKKQRQQNQETHRPHRSPESPWPILKDFLFIFAFHFLAITISCNVAQGRSLPGNPTGLYL